MLSNVSRKLASRQDYAVLISRQSKGYSLSEVIEYCVYIQIKSNQLYFNSLNEKNVAIEDLAHVPISLEKKHKLRQLTDDVGDTLLPNVHRRTGRSKSKESKI